MLLPTFQWATIATTNYDLLIEEAYRKTSNPLQNLLAFVKDKQTIETNRAKIEKPLNLLKLHGCIRHAHDSEIPLVLDNAHYERYDLNRKRLFTRLEDLAQEMPFVFIGYNLSDPHIQNIIHRLDRTVSRPEYYVVSPGIHPELADHWKSKRIIAIDAKFDPFMKALDAAILPLWRNITAGNSNPSLPLRKHFRTVTDPSTALEGALDFDLIHVHSCSPSAPMEQIRLFA